MTLFTIIILSAIFAETTFLVYKTLTKRNGATSGRRTLYVDTSALMDGRILKIAKTGFIGDNLVIPRSVIRELQLLADGKDSEKRMRARKGMEVASDLERVIYCNVEILQDELNHTPVDERLLELAKENNGMIISNDYNLQKVAATEKIEVLNVNNLASELRAEFLPGEKFKLHINNVGSNLKQGVGYLPDGTMAVVDNASKFVGKEVDVEFVKFIQTSSGRMIFAKLARKFEPKHQPKIGPKGRSML